MSKNKIILGTAQLNNVYGYSNNKIKFNKKNFNKTIKLMRKKNLNIFDTADGYNNHKILSAALNKSDKIISKITYSNDIDIDKELDKILKNLKINQIYGILIHNTRYIHKKKFHLFYEELKKKTKIKKLGFSCYKIKEIKYILKYFNFEILQFPFNILDQRLARENKVLRDLKSRKVEIHVRSVFLQGILLNKNIINDRYFKRWKTIFSSLERFKHNNKLTSLEACIYFLKQYKFYDKIVIGVENAIQLDNFLKIFLLRNKNKYKNYNFKQFSKKDEKLILPTLWKK
tara:strand:- start:226 stop:1086 length:861 start_codon:yes stop_codon:yes gene_type:complete